MENKPDSLKNLINLEDLIRDYYEIVPDVDEPAQQVQFGTSGHRGSASTGTFNQAHVLAITQAIVEYRKETGITGPIFVGKDTHALSEPALDSVLEVLAGNGVSTIIQKNGGYTPTPAISHAILTYNALHPSALADGIVITPSHNPPQDGGIKYNGTDGGPTADVVTQRIQQRANDILRDQGLAIQQGSDWNCIFQQDLCQPYVDDLVNVIDMKSIQQANLRIGVDPMGGSGLAYWQAIAQTYQLNLHLVNDTIDPTFSFMPQDHDGVIRMDCSSTAAMANLLSLKDDYDLAFGNDPDFDRHGIVTPAGLMNPNHFLAVCIDYLFQHRPDWPTTLSVGKTLVSSAMIDRVCAGLGKTCFEVPVGFKWFVEGLHQAILGFAGEESAGATLLRRNGQPWTTDKDGIVLCLLAAEIQAVTGLTPHAYYQQLIKKYGQPLYQRLDVAATLAQKQRLKSLKSEDISFKTLAGEPIEEVVTHAPGNKKAIGGLKLVTAKGWITARPSGTEALYKIYCESFVDEAHLRQLSDEAQQMIADLFVNLDA